MSGNFYRVGQQYKDTGTPINSSDQFLRWFQASGKKTIANMRGIRVLKIQNGELNKESPYACIVIVTNTGTLSAEMENPWIDVIDFNNGLILYWGDAKKHTTKKIDDWFGNKVLKNIWENICSGRREITPPILFFKKPKPGFVEFCGLVVIENLSIEWFADNDVPVPNYRFKFAILEENDIQLDWILNRVQGKRETLEPQALKKWIKTGKITRLTPWIKHIRTQKEQLPSNKSDRIILKKLIEIFNDRQFEKVVVDIFSRIPSISRIKITRQIKDGGFDFIGDYWLESINYQMRFKGEVKKWNSGVGPKDLARLVARLDKGEFGIFVTTSYYTKQAQEELMIDKYPVKLFSGLDLVGLLKELNLVVNGNLNSDWVDEIINEKPH
jgi:hypothetical protein